jgi:hypothetical protein
MASGASSCESDLRTSQPAVIQLGDRLRVHIHRLKLRSQAQNVVVAYRNWIREIVLWVGLAGHSSASRRSKSSATLGPRLKPRPQSSIAVRMFCKSSVDIARNRGSAARLSNCRSSCSEYMGCSRSLYFAFRLEPRKSPVWVVTLGAGNQVSIYLIVSRGAGRSIICCCSSWDEGLALPRRFCSVPAMETGLSRFGISPFSFI